MLVTPSDLSVYMDITFTLRQHDAAEFVLEGLQSELVSFLGRPIESDSFTETHVIAASEIGIPATSFFYDSSLSSAEETLNYLVPATMISLRNTPVISVQEVKIINILGPYQSLGEAMPRSASVTSAQQSGVNATFTAANNEFTIGQSVNVSDTTPLSFSISGKRITAVTQNTFTVTGVTETLGTYVSGGTARAEGNDYRVQRYGLELYRGFPNDVVEVTYSGGIDDESTQKMFKLMILRAATREMQNMHDDVVGVKDLNSRNVAPLETGFMEKELMAMKRYRRRRI